MGLDDPLDAQMVSLRVVKVLRYVALRVDDDQRPVDSSPTRYDACERHSR